MVLPYFAALIGYAWLGRVFVKRLQDRRHHLLTYGQSAGRSTKNQIQEDRHDRRNKWGLIAYWASLGFFGLPAGAAVVVGGSWFAIATGIAVWSGLIGRYGMVAAWMLIELRSKPEDSIAGGDFVKGHTTPAVGALTVGPERGTGKELNAFDQPVLFDMEDTTPRGYRR